MEDLESYNVSSTKKKLSLLWQRLVAYLAVLLTMLSFIFSCIGVNMGRQVNLEKSLYTFSFPYFNQIPMIKPGVVVSLDKKGYVFTGAGTTISRNVTTSKLLALDDIRVVAFGENVVISGSIGRLQVYEISYDDIDIDNPVWQLPDVGGQKRKVESLHKVGDSTLVIVGSGEMLAATVTVKEIDQLHYKVNLEFGQSVQFTTNGDLAYPHCDDLRDRNRYDMIACTYEEGENLVTRVTTIYTEAGRQTFKLGNPIVYGIRRQYHGLAGLGPQGYIVAAAGTHYNNTDHKAGIIQIAYVKDHNGQMKIGNWTTLPGEMTIGFFALDNMHANGAVLCYTRLVSNGINCVSIDVTGTDGTITFGSTVEIARGGSAIKESKTKLQIINEKLFGLMWSDNNVGGALSYQFVGFDNTGDMTKNGPAYLISQRNRDHNVREHYVGVTGIDEYKSAIVEIVKTDEESIALLHTVYVYPRAIGIAGKSLSGANQIQFGGVWNVNSGSIKQRKLVPGYMYYTNDRGMILRGLPAGYSNSDSGVNYIVSMSDDSILSLHNQIGIAVSDSELLIKLN